MKLLEQLNFVLKEQLTGINQSKKSIERPNQYFDYLIKPSIQGVNWLFVLSFKIETQRILSNDIQMILSSNCTKKKL